MRLVILFCFLSLGAFSQDEVEYTDTTISINDFKQEFYLNWDYGLELNFDTVYISDIDINPSISGVQPIDSIRIVIYEKAYYFLRSQCVNDSINQIILKGTEHGLIFNGEYKVDCTTNASKH